MAAALVNVLLERLATLAIDKIERELKMVVGVKQEVRNLTKKLEAIQVVLEEAEQRQEMEADLKLWLDELNDVSHDMDDVLDEWITRVLKHQLEKQEKQNANALVATKKKVCFPFPSSCFRFGQVNQLFLRHEIASKIKELNERLYVIDENRKSFIFQSTIRLFPELPERQKTTSLPDIKTFGRDEEKNLIFSKLLSASSQETGVPVVIPIVGMGGLGKTTLAQLVYNAEVVQSHFDKKIWVCVSDPFEEIKIFKAIIESLDKDNTSRTSNELQTLTQCIYELLEGKKFLLVLDDVWSPKLRQWEELIKPLRNGAMGSRVLVTTRKEQVATLMKATTQLIPLKELGEPFCLSLFYNSANMDESSVSKEFSDIGLKIVKRCNGLPLAAKTLGSLMCNKKKIHEWQVVLENKVWELKEIEEDVFRPLLLSYHDLTPAIKRCLLYCVVFPKDYIYNKNTLIELWMSQDYLNAKGSKQKIQVGQNYFDYLVMRSFFQDIEVDDENGNVTCKIHDIVHELLQFLTKNECLTMDFELADGEKTDVPKDKVHHLTVVHVSESDQRISFILDYKKLRTFSVIDSSTDSIGPIFELKWVRTLNLSVSHWRHNSLEEIPEMIGELIHLRYLDLSRNRELKELPSAISSLYNLQTLRLTGCDRLRRVDVGRLINLRHLYVSGCTDLQLIEGIEKLTDLQRLDVFNVIGGDVGNKLEDMKDLNQLQGSLYIRIWGNRNMAENAAISVNKAPLQQLEVQFFGGVEAEHREIMNSLEPHPGLESLSIRSYEGGSFPNWLLSLHSLRVLTIHSCLESQSLPPLGSLSSLESLHLETLFGVWEVGVGFLGIEGQTPSSNFKSFPKLKKLFINHLWSWIEWQGVEDSENNNITVMPCLSELIICGCKILKALPDFLWKTPLQKLSISRSPRLENLYGQGTGEKWAKISHIPSIEILYTPVYDHDEPFFDDSMDYVFGK